MPDVILRLWRVSPAISYRLSTFGKVRLFVGKRMWLHTQVALLVHGPSRWLVSEEVSDVE